MKRLSETNSMTDQVWNIKKASSLLSRTAQLSVLECSSPSHPSPPHPSPRLLIALQVIYLSGQIKFVYLSFLYIS